jgi:hypothetical protein
MFIDNGEIALFDFHDRESQLSGAMFQFVKARLLNHAGRLVAGE